MVHVGIFGIKRVEIVSMAFADGLEEVEKYLTGRRLIRHMFLTDWLLD
jgi:hypothetical protein